LTKTTHKITEHITAVETNAKPMYIWWLFILKEGQSLLLISSKVSMTREQFNSRAKTGPFRYSESLKLVATITFEYSEGVNLPTVMHVPDGDVLHKKLLYACRSGREVHQIYTTLIRYESTSYKLILP